MLGELILYYLRVTGTEHTLPARIWGRVAELKTRKRSKELKELKDATVPPRRSAATYRATGAHSLSHRRQLPSYKPTKSSRTYQYHYGARRPPTAARSLSHGSHTGVSFLHTVAGSCLVS